MTYKIDTTLFDKYLLQLYDAVPGLTPIMIVYQEATLVNFNDLCHNCWEDIFVLYQQSMLMMM